MVLAFLAVLMVGSGVSFGQQSELWEDDPFGFAWRSTPEVFDPLAPEVNEPLFAMILQWAADDSLGTWSGEDVLAYARAVNRPSKFPLEQLVSFSRFRPDQQDSKAWPGVIVHAVWELELKGDQTSALPYSILGYHPGTLRVSGNLRLAETHLGGMRLRGEDGATQISDIRIFRLELGTMILDADGWLDALLGKALDDAAVVGFVIGREQGQLVGLAVSLGKKGRRIYGEFDFRRDEVLPNGRALASALSSACRALLIRGQDHPLDRAWGR